MYLISDVDDLLNALGAFKGAKAGMDDYLKKKAEEVTTLRAVCASQIKPSALAHTPNS